MVFRYTFLSLKRSFSSVTSNKYSPSHETFGRLREQMRICPMCGGATISNCRSDTEKRLVNLQYANERCSAVCSDFGASHMHSCYGDDCDYSNARVDESYW